MASAVIINAYSARNAGDAAIMLTTASLLRQQLPGWTVTLLSRYADQDRKFFLRHNLRVVREPIAFPAGGHPINRAASLVAGVAVATITMSLYRISARVGERLARFLGRDGLLALLRADLVVAGGGGYLYSRRRLINLTLVHTALTVGACVLAGKNVVMMPQSIGPIRSRRDRWLVRYILGATTTIVVRERFSLETVRALTPDRAVRICPDVALIWGQAESSVQVEAVAARPVVVLVVMDWLWARPSAGSLKGYVEGMAALATDLHSRGIDVRLTGNSRIPEHGQDDLAIAAAIRDIARESAHIVGSTSDVSELARCFGEASVVVGTRLHSALLALAVGTPAIAVAYQPKAPGSYELLGLSDWCTDVELFRPDILANTVAAMISGGHDAKQRARVGVDRARAEISRTYCEILAPYRASARSK